ncbi:MAG: CPBP family intramembrane glutamic endopeptidase [Parasphingorhabdus sp.]|uniref:CPBP family intramembrane glutamic endopeptidase n=1 Tax=Parasphingorhabdus sp. TaxID=2709688 RepID=UPI003267BA11
MADFVRRPSMSEQQMSFGRPAFLVVAIVLSIDIAMTLSLIVLETGLEANGYEPPTLIEFNYSFPLEIFLTLVAAPVLEEALFRGWLTGYRRDIRFAAFAVGSLILVSLFNRAGIVAVNLVALVFLIVVAVNWYTQRGLSDEITPYFRKNFHWFVWGSSLLFGLSHLTNYSDATFGLDWLYIASQMLGGLLLAYTRVRVGLWAAILHHAAFNTLFFYAI